jgi:hypothetical protein
MTLRRTIVMALALMLAITSTAMIASAEEADLGLSNAQVFRIQALVQKQTAEIRTLHNNVETAREVLSAAIVHGDPVLIANAVLSLDAAEKALKHTEHANQRELLSLLNESQKQAVKDYSARTIPASE